MHPPLERCLASHSNEDPMKHRRRVTTALTDLTSLIDHLFTANIDDGTRKDPTDVIQSSVIKNESQPSPCITVPTIGLSVNHCISSELQCTTARLRNDNRSNEISAIVKLEILPPRHVIDDHGRCRGSPLTSSTPQRFISSNGVIQQIPMSVQ